MDEALEVQQKPESQLEKAPSAVPREEDPIESPNVIKGVVLTAICTLSLIIVSATLSSSLIALPVTGRDLNIPEDQLQWVTSAYALSSGCLLIPFGRVADLYGRRNVFLVGCVLQGVFALGCGFANDLVTLGVLRGFQGLGAAATIPASLGILAHTFPPGHARSLAFATFSAGQPLGGGVGFAIGGLLTQLSAPTWRSVYFLVSGLTVLCMIGALLFIDPDHISAEQDKRIDWLGTFLVTAGLTLVIFVLSDGEIAPKKWSTPYIIALLVVGVILTAAFLAWQWYLELPSVQATYSRWTPPPLMKLSLWRRGKGRFAAMQCIVFFLMCAFQSWILWAILYYESYKGYNPILTMVRMIPMIPAGIICNIFIGLLVGKIYGIVLISVGCLCTGLAGLLYAVINPDAVYWAFGFPAAIIAVVGADFVFAAGSIYIAKLALPHEQSLAGGLFQTMAQLGTSFGLAITTIVFDRVRAEQSLKLGVVIDSHGSNAPPDAQLKAYRAAQWTVMGFGVLASILGVIFLRGVGVVGGPHKPSPEEQKSEDEKTATEMA
ncbi:hypothetical protein QCA50_019298 [Cerrena zonata]|uniref:Major facilitator superfamily (MFS) profile domain-containing protein n=1 Tax=Cerrena zonata TaxID=2478898 RepID=A0AAW0FK81_9APHY